MLLTRENHSTHRKTHPSAIFTTKNPTWNGLGLNLGICHARPVTNHKSRSSEDCALNQTALLKLTIQQSTHYTIN
jgi:hypothetical protein